jgi:hypothetical protein
LRKITGRYQNGQAGKRCYNAESRLFVFPTAGIKFHVAAIR